MRAEVGFRVIYRLAFLVSLMVSNLALADVFEDFTAYADDQRVARHVPGMAIALIDGDQVHYINLGVLVAGKPDVVTAQSRFQIASMSKPVAAWLVMALGQGSATNTQANLQLDEPVSRYLKSWQLPQSEFDANGVTLARILSHTAGLSGPTYQGFEVDSSLAGGLPSLLDSLQGEPLASSRVELVKPPGDDYAYSGGGYSVAQLLLEDITDESFAELMDRRIFRPLQMHQATYDIDVAKSRGAAVAHSFTGKILADPYFLPELAAGGLVASAEDLVKFLFANVAENPVLNASARQRMHTAVTEFEPGAGFGLGFEVRGSLIGHGGQNRGWNAWMGITTDTHKGIVVLTNGEGGTHLIDPLRCKWNALFAVTELDQFCAQYVAQEQQMRRILFITTSIVGVVTILLVIQLIRNFRRNGNQIALSTNIFRRCLGIGLMLLVAGLGVILLTDMGTYIFAGIRWGSATVNYLPDHVGKLAFAIATLLLVLASYAVVNTSVNTSANTSRHDAPSDKPQISNG